MQIKEFTLMQKLLFCINSRLVEQSFNEIAYYLLLHYNEIENIPLNQLMEECYVSTSTVRRFSQSIGYENYSDLRESKSRNQENQGQMAKFNLEKERYNPYTLHNQISHITYQVGRSAQSVQIQRLAEDFVRADCSILFAIRPYAIFLEEFQCQMIAMGKTVYILEEVGRYRTLISRMGSNINSMVISPTGGIMSALGKEIEELPGKKHVMICPDYSSKQELKEFLSSYDSVVPLQIKTYDIEYMEMYGKYAVLYWFEILFGNIIRFLEKK